ncbi:hypothetical protein [Streptomyces sp. IBSBF 2806]|uniref:hypothetical protein n=1 Tax=Streptomyces sp. IBSBF 2806 TaxID=2903529 RepID=UPI002FDBD6C4
MAILLARRPTAPEVSRSAADSTDGRWLILADRQGTARRLAERMAFHGHISTLVFACSALDHPPGELWVNPAELGIR